ncbi:MAG: hypothetical protein ACLUI3_07490 [Christensenellales bacterium]
MIGAGLAKCEAAWQLAQRGDARALRRNEAPRLYACAPQRRLCRWFAPIRSEATS